MFHRIKGVYIAFEGIDFCGKSLQLKILENYLSSKGIKVITTREPGGTEFGESIRKALLDDCVKSPRAQALAFDACRANIIDTIVEPCLNNGEWVLTDRCLYSTQVYQGYGPEKDKKKAKAIVKELRKKSHESVKNILPDLTFFIDISYKTMLKRSRRNKHTPDYFEKKGKEFYERLIYGYHRIMKYYNSRDKNRIYLIDGERDIQEISIEIQDIISKTYFQMKLL